ncbi:MAG: sigma-70 family RNA polymerase sigma factor [Bacteroidota bacterium]
MNITQDKELAKDLFQEVSLYIWHQIMEQKLTYQGEGQFFAYTHKVIRGMRRKVFQTPEDEFHLPPDIDIEDTSDPEAIRRQIIEEKALAYALTQVDERCRLIFGYRSNGVSFKEIAVKMEETDDPDDDKASATLRNKFKRCMKKIEEEVRAYLIREGVTG